MKIPALKKLFNETQPGQMDVLVLAGDIGYPLNHDGKTNKLFIEFLLRLKKRFAHVLMVAGNHEYYSGDIRTVDQALQEICKLAGCVFLQRSIWIHPQTGVVFCGCTLWSKINEKTVYRLNDIGRSYESYNQALNLHKKDVKWLEDIIFKSDYAPLVIITHHAPSSLCVDDVEDINNSGYFTDLEYLMEEPRVIAWIYGHTHTQCNFEMNGVKIISNPVGYTTEYSQIEYNPTPYLI